MIFCGYGGINYIGYQSQIVKQAKAAAPSIFADPFGTFGINLTLMDGYAQDLGIDTTRGGIVNYNVYNWSTGVWNFKDFDDKFSSVAQGGLNLIVTLYIPVNINQIRNSNYAEWVRRTTERYDGDSDYGCTQSAPDCYSAGDNQYPTWDPVYKPSVKYFQVENEIDVSTTWVFNPMLQNPAYYAEAFNISYSAVKEKCADCQVILGSSAGSLTEAQNYFDQVFPLIGNNYDGTDTHKFNKATGGQYLEMADRINYFKNKNPQKLILVTETATYTDTPLNDDGTPKKTITEEEQAAELVKRYIYSVSVGAKKVMWDYLYETTFGNSETFFWYTGLVYDGIGQYDKGAGVKKLGYYAYKKMSEKLKGSDWSNMVTLEKNDNNVYLFKLIKNGNPIYVAWWDWYNTSNSQTTVTLPVNDIITPTASVTQMVPSASTGQNVTDYTTAFIISNPTVTNGSIIVTLDKKPVIIEEGAFVPPTAPLNLNGSAVSAQQINLNWSDNSNNEASFKIFRKNGLVYENIASVAANVTGYSDTGLTPAIVYQYKIAAHNNIGDSGYSNEISVTTQSLPACQDGSQATANCACSANTCSIGQYCCSGACLSSFCPIATCQESDWKYTDGECQSNNTQTRTWTKIGNCQGGITHPASESLACTYRKYTLTDFINLLIKWHKTDTTYDLNNDGVVNAKDLGLMMRNFGL